MNTLKSVILSSVVAGTVLGALGAGAAYADQKKPNTTSGLSCPVAGGWYYPPGTKVTVTMRDGTKDTYVCDGDTGKWVQTAALKLPVANRSLPSGTLTRIAR